MQRELLLELFEMNLDELRMRFEDGQSIAGIGESLGIALEDIVETLLQPIRHHLESAVKQGRIGEAEAAERLEEARNNITKHAQATR